MRLVGKEKMERYMGIDYGVRRIGVALSDLLGVTAQPHSVIKRENLPKDIARLKEIAVTNGVGRIILGFPYNMNGTEGSLAAEVRGFGTRIHEAFGIPVDYYDERLTTMEADRMLIEQSDMSRERRKQVRDKIAAAIFLQAYLNSKSQ